MTFIYGFGRACVTVQKFVRMFLAKRKKKFLKETKFTIVLQKFARCYLAKKIKRNLKRNKSAKKIQVTSYINIFLI